MKFDLESTDADRDGRGDICPVLPWRLAAALMGVDPATSDAHRNLEIVQSFPPREDEAGLVRSASFTAVTGRTVSWAEVDRWYADSGQPNAARTWEERQRAAREQAEAAEREREEAEAERERKLSSPEHAEELFEKAVEAEVHRLRVKEAAQRRKAALEAGDVPLPPVTSLADLLAEDDDPVRFRIQDVFPSGGARIIFAAPEKAGKTTLLNNLTRSLADGDPFLGRFEVHTTAQRIMRVDNEMSAAMTRRWLRKQGIRKADAVADVVTLRGKAGLFDLGDDKRRAEWARRMSDQGIDFLIFDCLRPVLDALGLDENRETGKFLGPFDALLEEAGCQDALIAHHMGHQNERARGDSRIVGWSDGNWKVVRDEESGPDPLFFFSAKVRDGEEDVREGLLSFDPATCHLTYAGGSRVKAKADAALERVVSDVRNVLTDHQAEGGTGMTTTALCAAVKGKKATITEALRDAEERNLIVVARGGPGKPTFHRITPAGADPSVMDGREGDAVVLSLPGPAL
ncbi:AAA family ATPase [Nocardia puris]|uniref:AAA family ATPase n=1 Tax=Nocardia puris TaxID=208602 RepID=UPI001893CAA1|nr:AAA family ATPase [Nocardia puris]MBF6460293.1 AAA family ATPase [Nocardia puris]